jgi:hypothetical protein
MSVKVAISYPYLQQFTHNQEIVEVNGSTVGGRLDDLVKQFPGIEKGIFDEHGQLLSYVLFFINGKSVHPIDLAMPIEGGSEVTIALLLTEG